MSNNTLVVAMFLAFRTILKNKKTLIIISLVLAMSFVSLTFFGGIINGLAYKFENQIITGSTGHVLIEPQDDEKYIENADNLNQKLIKLPLTSGVTRRIKVGGSLETDELSLSKTITGINPNDESQVTTTSTKMLEGNYLSENDLNEVVLGSALIKKYASKSGSTKLLDVETGDKIEIFFNNGVHEEFRLKGVYKTGANFNDQEVYITNKKLFSIYPELDNHASEIAIRLPRRGFEKQYREQLISLLSVRDKISDWTQKTDRIEQFTGSLILVNQVTYVMGILTAIATIYIIIYIDVIHKRKQIGILKSIGINKNVITLSFVIQSVLYGVIGVFLGLIVIYILQSYIAAHPLKMPIGPIVMMVNISDLAQSGIILILSSTVAGFLPAYNASKDNIVDAIVGG